MAKERTCQGKIDMQALEDRQLELEKAWNDLLKEKREVDARIRTLEQQEKQFERKKKFYEHVQSNVQEEYSYGVTTTDNVVQGEMFFSGVSDKKALKKRYKDLIKIYHPDGDAGDTATVAEINREYEDLKAQMN